MEKIRQTSPMSGLHPVINHDAGPTYMSRSGGKGPRGNGGTIITSRAKYGLAEGQDVVRMSRSGGSGPGGKNFGLTHTGPTRMSRKATGSASHDEKTYGVAGVSGNGGTGYGVGGI